MRDDDELAVRSAAIGLVLTLIGVAAMGGGGWFAAAGAERLVDLTGVGASVAGLTAVALATNRGSSSR